MPVDKLPVTCNVQVHYCSRVCKIEVCLCVASLQTKARVVALEEQLHALAGQRDEAVMELSTAREEAERDAAALRNLQSVLEQFHRGQHITYVCTRGIVC